MDCHVHGPRMPRAIEMVTNVLLHVPPIYHSEVGFKSVYESTLGLAHILNIASFASDAVDQVGTLTCDIHSSLVCPASARAFQSTSFVQYSAISAVFGSAGID